MGARNLNISVREAVSESGGCVNETMDGQQRLPTGHEEEAARTALEGNNQIRTRPF